MHSVDEIHGALLEAFKTYLIGSMIPGIEDAELVRIDTEGEELRGIAATLENEGVVERTIPAHVSLYLRISEDDLLIHEDHDFYPVELLSSSCGHIIARVNSTKNWAASWESGIAPLKENALEIIRRGVISFGSDLNEDSGFVRSATVLLASEMIGPYPDRLSWFTGYPVASIQIIGARLLEAKLWNGQHVDCKPWFEPHKGFYRLILDLSIAAGELSRVWSDERKDWLYRSIQASG